MAATSSQTWTIAPNPQRDWIQSGFVLRCFLAGVGVLMCYQFRWDWLRYLTSEANLRVDALLGISMQRISSDTLLWNGHVYRYVIACTFADVWCGALAFLWIRSRSITNNVVTLLEFTIGLFAFDVLRLSVSDYLCAHGVSWNLGHNVVGGICYFLVWKWLQRNRSAVEMKRAQPNSVPLASL
ncbi:MAG TPA: hypothetical protein VG897_16240 [Terriglobales bacterium]|nr:hypothetical protein [Terriglobales bacterium]